MQNSNETAELVGDNQPVVALNPLSDDSEAQSFALSPAIDDDDELNDDTPFVFSPVIPEYQTPDNLEPEEIELDSQFDELDDLAANLDDQGDDLDGFSQDLDGFNEDLEVVNGNLEAVNSDLEAISPQLAADSSDLADKPLKLVNPSDSLVSEEKMTVILNAIEAMPKATKKGSPPVGVRAEIYEEIKAICEEGGISVVDYVSSIMMHHKEFFDFQTTQKDLSKANTKVIDLMSELSNLRDELSKVNSAHDLLGSVVYNKDAETDELKAIIAQRDDQITILTQQVNSLRETIMEVSNDVEEKVGGFYKVVFPEGHRRAMEDLYQEKIYPATVTWGTIKLPTEEHFNNFYNSRLKYHYDQIIKELEIKANLQAKNQRNNDV